MSNNLVAIKLFKPFRQFNIGEIAGFDKKLAANLVKEDMGKYYNKKDEVKEKKKSQAPAPEAKVMMNKEDLADQSIENIKKELSVRTSDGSRLYPVEYLSELLDFESLNKQRDGLMEYLIEKIDAEDEEK